MVFVVFHFTAVPADFTAHLTDTEGKENTSATFTCSTNEDELPVQWFINGNPISPSDKYQIVSDGFDHTLTILNLSPDDNCEVTVVIGDNKSSAKLAVEGLFWLDFIFCLFLC